MLLFRTPKIVGATAEDFAETIYWVIESRFEQDGSMTIADINQLLDEIATKYTQESSNLHITISINNNNIYFKSISLTVDFFFFYLRRNRTDFTVNTVKI